jgi:UDP-N-acetyl-D-glucosamine dehydrogenase
VRIAVVGLGKIGLPLSVQFASLGHQVVGIDLNADTVAKVNSGLEPFPGETHLQDQLDEIVPSGRLRATMEYAEGVPYADAVVLVVPLLVDEDTSAPDFSSIDAATRALAKHLTSGTLVIYETTLPVGTTRSRIRPMLEAGSRLKEGKDFHLVFSPERILTGRIFADLRKYPKLIGGLSAEGAAKATSFYESVLVFDERSNLSRPNGVWDLGSAEAAELAKLAETTYRDYNIALANQFALYADTIGIDIYRVIEASNSQPYSHIHRPGIAVGGHCIPVYPWLYLATDPGADIVRSARLLNASMPERLVTRAEAVLGSLADCTAVVLGAAYRGGVKETAFSGVFAVADSLRKRGARVLVHDPLYAPSELAGLGLDAYRLGQPADLAIVHSDHREYRLIGSSDFPGIRLLIDGRNITQASRWIGTPRLVFGGGGLGGADD